LISAGFCHVLNKKEILELNQWEEEERTQRSLQRRLANAHLGRFKPLADFDWTWPKRCEREVVEELMSLAFVREAANAILIGPNGVGKTTLARNIAYQVSMATRTDPPAANDFDPPQRRGTAVS
jgi:DNA replication protein DnaC